MIYVQLFFLDILVNFPLSCFSDLSACNLNVQKFWLGYRQFICIFPILNETGVSLNFFPHPVRPSA